MASSVFSKVDEYGFERPPDFDYKVYGNFMSQYLKVLAKRSKKWNNIMKNNKRIIRNRKLKRYIRKGIPSEYRARVWLEVSGANDAKTENGIDLYSRMLNSHHDREMMEIIRTDLPRTFPDNIFFSPSSDFQQQLFRVLIAYANHNKAVGYCQGMNYIVGLLLLVTKSEDTSFWLLKMLVENILPDYYSPSMGGLVVDIEAIAELVRMRHPDINSHVTYLGLPWPVVLSKWLICLFCDVLPIETVLRIWDCLFNEGSKILFRVSLAVIRHHRSNIMSCDQFTDLANYLKNMMKDPFSVNCHYFMKEIFRTSGECSTKTITQLRMSAVQNREAENKSKTGKVS